LKSFKLHTGYKIHNLISFQFQPSLIDVLTDFNSSLISITLYLYVSFVMFLLCKHVRLTCVLINWWWWWWRW